MDPVLMSFAGSAVQFIVKHGVPAAKRVIEELADKDDPTMADIEALDVFLKDPESYFEKQGE